MAENPVLNWRRSCRSGTPPLTTGLRLRAKPPPPPDDLQPATQAWWTSIVTDFELEQYQLHVLQAAAEAWDLYQYARAELAVHGLTYTDDKGMIRPRPEAAIARDARTSFLRAVRELKLDVEPPKPPRVGGIGWMPP